MEEIIIEINEVKPEPVPEPVPILLPEKPASKKRGRKPGQIWKRPKYQIQFYNFIVKDWQLIGNYASLRVASNEIGISYHLLSDLYIGKSRFYKRFLKVVKLA